VLFRSKRSHKRASEVNEQLEARTKYVDTSYNELWSKVLKPTRKKKMAEIGAEEFPQENLLKFVEKRSKVLKPWQREILHIVRSISQYFMPQIQTKMLNEGYASFIHHTMMTKLHDDGYISEGNYLEFLHSHTSVCMQPDHSHRHYSGINPYSLGYALFNDVKQMCLNPTKEDYKLFPDIAGGDWKKVTKDIVENYRDESAILQFLSPRLASKFKFFSVLDTDEHPRYEVTGIQDDEDFKYIRKVLASQYTLDSILPHIEIIGVDQGSKGLKLLVKCSHNRGLDTTNDNDAKTLHNLMMLYGDNVTVYYQNKGELFPKEIGTYNYEEHKHD